MICVLDSGEFVDSIILFNTWKWIAGQATEHLGSSITVAPFFPVPPHHFLDQNAHGKYKRIDLSQVRVILKNLLYVIGLAP